MKGTSTLRISWRNLWRSRRRTGLALAAIGLSVGLVLVYDSILRAYGDWMVEAITGPMLGHVQLHAPGWRKDRAMDRTIRSASSIVEALRRDPDVAGANGRIYAPALAAQAEEGFAVLVVGVDVPAESQPLRLLDGVRTPLGGRRVLMGRHLAEQMGVHTGDAIALVGQGADGSLANDLFAVVGFVETSVDVVNRQGVVMSLGDAQTLFAMPGEVHEIVVHARDPAQVKRLAASLARRPELRQLEVMDWQALAPELVSLMAVVNVAWIFVLVLVLVAAAAGVANTMLMATFERTHELGMLLALGTGPGRIVRMILAESVALGVVGAFLGTALAVTFVALTHRNGFDFAAVTGGGPNAISFAGLRWSMRLYPSLAFIDVARTVTAVVVTSLLAAAWPAARASRLQPAQALRE
jgi:ABC-type lipoprotein release transport system permease subunit